MVLKLASQLEMLGLEETERRARGGGATQHERKRLERRVEVAHELTVPNSAGGHAFPVDDWTRLDRFLVLGSEGGSYYVGEATLTRDNAGAVLRAIAADRGRAIARIVAVSKGGRAPKNEPALFALALAAAAEDLGTRRAALAALSRVARTGTHLFQFATFAEGARGWGRVLRRVVEAWYANQPAGRLNDGVGLFFHR